MSGRVNPATLQDVAADLRIDPLVLERDWVLTEIIYHLAQQSIGQDLVLKGGQALRHIYGSERFSKDADYAACPPQIPTRQQGMEKARTLHEHQD